MKFFLVFFDDLIFRPSYKFYLNLFFIKNNFYFIFKNLLFIHFFTNIKRRLTINALKFSYLFYKNFILYFIIGNILLQLYLVFILI